MKNKVSIVLLLIFGFAFLVYIFPFNAVHAAKIQSGVTVIAPAGNTPPPAGTCTDSNNDGVDDVNGQPCSPTGPPVAGTCELQIVSGVPINYGQLDLFQMSADQKVIIKNAGTLQTPATIMIKGGNWISDAAGSPTISGPEATHYALAPNLDAFHSNALTSSGYELPLGISGGQSLPIYFRFWQWVPPHFGSFHQDVTIDLLC